MILMAKLKETPKDEILRKELRDIQKHISELGAVQKQLSKAKSNEKKKVKDENNTTNIESKDHTIVNGSSFIKIGSQDKTTSVGQLVQISSINYQQDIVSQPNQTSTTGVSILCNGGAKSPPTKINFMKPHETKELTKVLISNGVIKPNTHTVLEITQQTNNPVLTNGKSPDHYQPLNLTKSGSNSNNKLLKTLNNGNSVLLPLAPLGDLGALSPTNSANHPVKFRVPVTGKSGGRSIVLLSTAKIHNDKPTFRLVSPRALRPNLASTPNITETFVQKQNHPKTNQTQVWLNMAATKEPSCFVPIGNESKLTNSEVDLQNIKSLEKLSQKIVMTPKQTNYIASTSPDHLAPSPEIDASLDQDDEKPSLPKSARNYAAVSTSQLNKHDFLSQLHLVPKERAERLRNRRYGRRKVAANPVYSGGIYVSTSAAESAKRLLPPELLGLEDTVPAKRSRGRPRNSTKRSDITEEVSHIIEQAKPLKMKTPLQDSSVIKTRVKRRSDSDPHNSGPCGVCQKSNGGLISCDTCGCSYHLHCTKPVMDQAPTNMWFCVRCKHKFSDPSTASTWPGLQSIVHSYFTFEAERNAALQRARKRRDVLIDAEKKLNDQVKALVSTIMNKVTKKYKVHDSVQNATDSYQRLLRGVETLKHLSEFAVTN
uniref:uncharacterized protein LOC100180821 isoform X2 n=1 Tax=Ciona intestinalis TaxID=7719 RepID=UPI000EF48CC8|nr:uncharacterized protein LOC100180821 isoform X2 [Ciona intestinalis]|eukprot:XP_026693985.1 uncharacterized protein LOC100180821 isoform X2 [Ciona intestinalis]